MAENSVFLNALGLNTETNRLNVKPGTMLEASNVIIRNTDVVEPRRGFKLYGQTFGSVSDRAKQLIEYRNTLIRHYSDVLQWDTQVNQNNTDISIFNTFAGNYEEVEPGLRIKSLEANGNLYFTTADGIKKISATSAGDFSTESGFIVNAGGLKALDLTARLNYIPGSQTSFFNQDSVVAYRVVWASIDANQNLIQGAPSERVEIFNPMLTLMLQDYSRVLNALDQVGEAGGSLISDINYVSTLNLPISATATSLRDNLVSLATKIDTDITYTSAVATVSTQRTSTTNLTIIFASNMATYLQAGDQVILSGFTTADLNSRILTVIGTPTATVTFQLNTGTFGATDGAPVPDATGVVTSYDYRALTQPPTPTNVIATHDELVDIQDYLGEIITSLQSELTGVISAASMIAYIDPLFLTTTSTVILNFSIPPDATTNNFYQIYRTAVKMAVGTDILSDLSAGDEQQLVFEQYVTQAQLDAGEVSVEDVTLDSFRGAFLYTNEQSGEGILQANDSPPLAHDINRYKFSVFYSNTSTKQQLGLSLLGVADLISEYDAGRTPRLVISTADGYESNVYEFKTGTEEVTPITTVADVAGSLAGKYFTINNANDLVEYYVWYKVSGVGVDPVVANKTGILVLISTGDAASVVASKTRDTLNSYINDFTATAVGALLTVTNINEGYTTDATAGTSGFTIGVITQGTGEIAAQEISQLTCGNGATAGLAGKYFTLNTADDRYRYYVWFTVNGTGSDPVVANRTGVQVAVLSTDTSAQVATKVETALNALDHKFIAEAVSNVVTITNYKYGYAAASTIGTMPAPFTITTTQNGDLIVLLSGNTSPALAVQETAQSLVRIINKNKSEVISAFYLSGPGDVPGKMQLQAKNLATTPFYLLMNKDAAATVQVGDSFNPVLTPTNLVTTITAGNPVTLTSAGHGLTNGDSIILSNTSNQTAAVPNFDGVYVVSAVTTNTFQIANVQVITGASRGSFTKVSDRLNAVFSDNQRFPNRIYYSKPQQPEAVPALNYIDIGPKDKAIIRIIPLRDSLMIFKEEGLYRLSGELAPWSVSLFDRTCHIVAADSVGVVENLIYLWTNSGIAGVTESGVINVGRPIDVDLLPKNSPQYINFHTATWGVGYDDDSTYLVWTTKEPSDEVATICYLYNVLTNTWTTYDKTNTCGIVFSPQSKLYLGAGDVNSLEAERKDFARTDYADREIQTELFVGNYLNNGLSIALSDVSDFHEGDVLLQDQYLSIYDFNAILEKLDIDPGVDDTTYFSVLGASGGEDMRDKLANPLASMGLAAKLDADLGVSDTDYLNTIASKSGTITAISVAVETIITTSAPHELQTGRIVQLNSTNSTPSVDGTYEVAVISPTTFRIAATVTTAGTTGTFDTVDDDFRDIRACFNAIATKLNADPGVSFSNYALITNNTIQEAVILSVNGASKTVTLNIALPFVVGPMLVFECIDANVIYSPILSGDPIQLKQWNTCHVLLKDQTFTQATVSFSTDLLPAFNDVKFRGQGNGIFGHANFGSGQFFGGLGNNQPFRTYIPRNAQRATALNVKFHHCVAREQVKLLGISIWGNFNLSERPYR